MKAVSATDDCMAITAKNEGNKLIITAGLETPAPSSSGKTLAVASMRGNKETDVVTDGKPVINGLHAYLKKQVQGHEVFPLIV